MLNVHGLCSNPAITATAPLVQSQFFENDGSITADNNGSMIIEAASIGCGLALTNATFPYLLKLAKLGAKEAILADSGFAEGVNTYNGTLTYKAVAEAQGRSWQPVAQRL